MKKALHLLIFMIFISSKAVSFDLFKDSLLQIRGDLINCKDKKVTLIVGEDIKPDQTFEIPVTAGHFQFETNKINTPVIAHLYGSGISISNLLIAPGYSLHITADASDFKSLSTTRKITGAGSGSNLYYCIMDSIISSEPNINTSELSKTNLIRFIQHRKKTEDSVFNKVFDNKRTDHATVFFRRQIDLNNNFERMIQLTDYIHANKSNLSADEMEHLLTENIDKDILSKIMNEEYLSSNPYWFLMADGYGYISYLLALDEKRIQGLKTDRGYAFKKIDETYKGKIRDYALFYQLRLRIAMSGNYEELAANTPLIKTYLSKIQNQEYVSNLTNDYDARETAFVKSKVGMPAPLFTLKDSLGKTYSLKDFYGKLVYIDLWASWCIPCRNETPFLKALYDKYKNDPRIRFVSIAIRDNDKDWKQALKQDQPGWLQLFDDGSVNTEYVANEIPKFVLIDKKGNIINLKGPLPSSGNDVEKLINDNIDR